MSDIDKGGFTVPGITGNQAINVLTGAFVGFNRRVFRNLNSEIRRIPSLDANLRPSGGIDSIVANAPNPSSQAELLDFASSMQTGLFLDRFTEGTLDNLPSVQELREGINNIISITTEVKQHLDECCEEIKFLIKDLRKLVLKLHRLTITQVQESVKEIKDLLGSYIDSFKEIYTQDRSDLSIFYDREKLDFLNKIKETVKEEVSPLHTRINELEEELKQTITESASEIKTRLTTLETNVVSKLDPINDKLETIDMNVSHLKSLLNAFQDSWNTFRLSWDEFMIAWAELFAAWTEYLVSWAAFAVNVPLWIGESTTSVLAGVAGLGKTVLAKYLLNQRGFNNKIINLNRNINSKIDEDFKEFKEYSEDKFEKIPLESGIQTSLLVVGEAYTRWDSTTTYYPCLVFIFNEKEITKYRRRSQVKLRLNILSQDLKDSDIVELKNKISKLTELEYLYGQSRGYYVSLDKRFKTTIYAHNKTTQENLLKSLFDCINEIFRPELLSTTDALHKRPSLTRRRESLDNVTANYMTYQEPFFLKLRKASLLVNGLSSPIQLFLNNGF